MADPVTLTTSAEGRAALSKDEGFIDGLYDDPVGYCTFGVGHLVHPTGKWSCFLLAAARTMDSCKGKLATTLGVRNLPRSAVSWPEYRVLESTAIELGTATVAKRKYGKPVEQLSVGEKTAAQGIAEAAVRVETHLIAKTVSDVLASDLGRYEQGVRDAITAVKLTQEEFDALVSLAFNIGVANFKGSTLVKRINDSKYRTAFDRKVREKGIADIEAAFGMWNKSGGKVLSGLTKRRKSEADRFLKNAREQLASMPRSPATGSIGVISRTLP